MSRIPFPLLSALLLAGCASVPQLGEAPKPAPVERYAASESFKAPAAQWPADSWWTSYGDPQLDGLMQEALAGSPDLAQAAARVRAADAQARISRAATLPSLSANAQAAEVKQSYNNGFPAQFVPHGYQDTGRGTLDLSFDLDLWGRNRAALAAATSEAEAARMAALATTDANKAKRLKERLKLYLEEVGLAKYETARFKLGIALTGGKLPLLLDEEYLPSDLPAEFQRVTIEVDSDALRRFLEAPHEYPSNLMESEIQDVLAHVRLGERGTHLRIR